MKNIQNKKNKLILIGLMSFGAIGSVAMAATIASCSTTIQKGFFPLAANDVYKEIQMVGKTLDEAGYKDKSKVSMKFEDKAKQESEKVKTFIKLMSNKLKEQNLIKEDTTALFLKNYDFQYSDNESELLKNLNNFSMEQPILYSQLYSNADNSDAIPNLGIKFPTPLNESGMQFFDDWWEIGAAAKTSSTGSLLARNWRGTADYVFYLYDSTFITQEQETKLKNFIFKKEDNNFTAWTLFKESAAVKKVIPLDLQYFYNGTWDLIGTQHIVKMISLIIGALKNENLNSDRTDIDSSKLDNDVVYKAIKTESTKATFNPIKLTEANKLQAPDGSDGMTLGTSGFNSLAHLITLGILPDFTEYNADSQKAKQNIFYSGYLTQYMPDNPIEATMLPLEFGKNANTKENIEVAKGKKLYSVVADRSRYGAVASKWTFENPTIEPNLTTAKGLGSLMNQGILKKAIFTERNDSSLTQFKLEKGFVMFNAQTKKLIDQSEYVKSNKYLN